MGSQSRVAHKRFVRVIAGQVLGYIFQLGQFSWLINRMPTR